MKTRLFLDDIRVPKDCLLYMTSRISDVDIYKQKWEIVRSYDQFIEWIVTHGMPEIISFDHDLGDEMELTGMDCAKWLVEFCMDNYQELPQWVVHSSNPAGSENINGLLTSFKNRK